MFFWRVEIRPDAENLAVCRDSVQPPPLLKRLAKQMERIYENQQTEGG